MKQLICKLISPMVFLLIPHIVIGMEYGFNANQIAGEYSLTKSSEQKLIQAGLEQQADLYKTLYILQSVNGLEIEAQNSQQGGAPLTASAKNPYGTG